MRTRPIVAALVISAGTTLLATDFLTEGVDNARTGWVKDEKIFTHGQRRQHEAAVEGEARSTPRAMHNLFAPLIAERVDDRRRARARSASSPASPTTCSASTSRPASRCGIGSSRRADRIRRPWRTTRCVPAGRRRCRRWRRRRRASTRSTPCRGTAGCGRSTSPTARTSRPPEKFMPGGGKPYALNLVQRRHLHRDGAGLRRPDQRVLLVRSRDAASASAFIPAGGGLWGRRGASVSARGHRVSRHRRRASSIPRPRAARQRHRRREDRREQAAAARRLLRRAQRQLAVPPRPRRERHAGARSTIAAASSWWARARNAGCGCSTATRSAARITARRCTPRRCSATTRRRSTARASGAR